MKYNNTVCAKFIDRPNRFIAHVDISGKTETVHVKNTGRCKELLLPGVDVILEKSDNPARSTLYDLISVRKESLGWVNIDSQIPNKVVHQWLLSSPSLFPGITLIHPEYVYGNSRVDFYVECGSGRKILLEVKGCTLERNRTGFFPDAPTERGVKHLHELTGALSEGYESFLVFVIAMPHVSAVLPNAETDPAFEKAFYEAQAAGVKVVNLSCFVSPNEIYASDFNISENNN